MLVQRQQREEETEMKVKLRHRPKVFVRDFHPPTPIFLSSPSIFLTALLNFNVMSNISLTYINGLISIFILIFVTFIQSNFQVFKVILFFVKFIYFGHFFLIIFKSLTV